MSLFTLKKKKKIPQFVFSPCIGNASTRATLHPKPWSDKKFS
jgi:hypothetical protein